RLPVALRRQHLVDRLERLQRARDRGVGELLRLREEAIERLVVVLDRLVERLQLVAAQRRRGVVVRALARTIALERDEPLDRLDRLLPLLGLRVELEQLLQ